ncbi:MAG: 2-oxoacid:acceptor oxidoreductase subunit alpha [Chitinophagaceae bacterium]
MSATIQEVDQVVIKFAGDSGDGIQLTGSQFTINTALQGNDLSTFPDFPAEIRAPQGTLPGVSGFQLHFSSSRVFTPGDICDVLVVMNAAALKVNLGQIKKGGIIIANTDGFDSKNLRLANYPDGEHPLENDSLSNYQVFKIDVTKLTREALKDSALGTKEKDRAKNMFVLGFLYWMYDRNLDNTISFIKAKFSKKPDILESNISVLKAGYHYGETTEVFSKQYTVSKAKVEPGQYRSITGNSAITLGLLTAAQKTGLPLFLGSYPITPASDILHELSNYKQYQITTFQAEDEIAAIASAIGASYGGSLGVTTTSGPGMALKTEAMGLALMLEIPLLIINVQRGGPSTGLPTKTEQSDLLQAYYGRNGESPIPIIASSTPSDCFWAVLEATRIAIRFMTPVILLSDGYIANGAEPWKFPKSSDIEAIPVQFKSELAEGEEKLMPYLRNSELARPWIKPGTPHLEHRIGGLEKQDKTGTVSYDADNHEWMVKTRQAKVDSIAQHIPAQSISLGKDSGELLVLGWGSTYGVIRTVVGKMIAEGKSVSHCHLTHLRPFPANLKELLGQFKKVLIPEINNGQLVKIIRSEFLIDAQSFNKIKGTPITELELSDAINALLM